MCTEKFLRQTGEPPVTVTLTLPSQNMMDNVLRVAQGEIALLRLQIIHDEVALLEIRKRNLAMARDSEDAAADNND